MDMGLVGGDKLKRHLQEMYEKLNTQKRLRVGFDDEEHYPDRQPAEPKHRAEGKMMSALDQRLRRNSRALSLSPRKATPGPSVAQVAHWMEYGTTSGEGDNKHQVIPPRPFFRTMLDEYGPQLGSEMAGLLRRTKGNADEALDIMGRKLEARLKESILKLDSPPLADSTVRRKGHSKPLINSGLLLASATYWLVDTQGGSDESA